MSITPDVLRLHRHWRSYTIAMRNPKLASVSESYALAMPFLKLTPRFWALAGVLRLRSSQRLIRMHWKRIDVA